jgi:tRNA(Ile)-lysidine synthase
MADGRMDERQVSAPSPGTLDSIVELAARVREALSSACGAPAGTRLHLAVSGGADSVALAALVGHLGEWPVGAVVFVDHGLREVSAEREAARGAAERLGAPFRELPVRLPGGANLQARARNARYRALIAAAEADGALVATGHTSTDQAETVLSRMLRGAGVSGLAGLAPRLGRVIRPMLSVSREETRALGLPFADDPSNTTTRFLRNRVRQGILPALQEENPRVVEALAALAGSARGTRALISTLLAAVERAGAMSELPLTPESATALLHHLASEAGAAPTRRALSLWADALVARRPARVALGDGLEGVVDARGEPRVQARPDPRQAVRIDGPGHYVLAGLRVRVSAKQNTGWGEAVRVEGPLPWQLRPTAGAQAAQRGLTELDAPVVVLEDAAGRTLGRIGPGPHWVVTAGDENARSRSPVQSTVSSDGFYVAFDTSVAATQSEVVAPPTGPLTSGDQTIAASNPAGGIQGLPNQGRAPTETKSSSRIPRSGRLS